MKTKKAAPWKPGQSVRLRDYATRVIVLDCWELADGAGWMAEVGIPRPADGSIGTIVCVREHNIIEETKK